MNGLEEPLNPRAPLENTMSTRRRTTVTFLEGKKMPGQVQVKFTSSKSNGAKLVSLLEGKRSPGRTRFTIVAKRGPRAPSR